MRHLHVKKTLNLPYPNRSSTSFAR